MASAIPNSNPTDDRSPALQGVAVTLLILAVSAFSLRTYVRAVMIKTFGMDDWLMTGATVAFIVYSSCVLAGIYYGTGRHFADLSASDARYAMKFWFFCYLGYCWTMILSKLSIGVFLLRIVTQRVHAWILYLVMALSSLTGLIFFFLTMLQCRPVSHFWDRVASGAGSCIDIDIIIALGYLYSALNILCDFTFALLPVAIVQKLNMPRRLKMATIPLLTLGCVASSGVVVRLAYVQTLRQPDFLYETVNIAVWSTVEAGLAITAGSLACTRPVFRAVLYRLGFSTSDGRCPQYPPDMAGRGPFPETIGSAQSRRATMFRLGSLPFYAGHGNNKAGEIMTTKDHDVSTEIEWNEWKSSHAFTFHAASSGTPGAMSNASARSDLDLYTQKDTHQGV